MNDLETVTTLAAKINQAHAAASQAAQSALGHARDAGLLLMEAKAQLPHGGWLPWLTDHCPTLPERTAQLYMKIARGWRALPADPQRVADLSVRQAVALLTAPQPTTDTEHGSAPAASSVFLPSSKGPVPLVAGASFVGTARKRGTLGGRGSMAFIVPYVEDPRFAFVSVIDGAASSLTGLRRPIRLDFVHAALDYCHFPAQHAEWCEGYYTAWRYNELFYEDERASLFAHWSPEARRRALADYDERKRDGVRVGNQQQEVVP